MLKLSEEEREYLRNAGGGGGAVVVVEYLETTMSKELLGKFPDNSAFDFDYTQSSIWSPLIPRRHFVGGCGDLDIELLGKSLGSASTFSPTVLQRKLIYKEDDCDGLLGNNGNGSTSITIKKMTANFKKKVGASVFNNLKIYRDKKMKKKQNKKKAFALSSNGCSNSPTPRKGWAKMLKTASGHFKKTGKKHDCFNGSGGAHLKLSNNYLPYSNY